MLKKETKTISCPDCGKNATCLGVWGDGKWSNPITGYTPKEGELVRNIETKCSNCGLEECS